jgi:MFS family permease
MLAMVAGYLLSRAELAPYYAHRSVFLVGILPAILVFWIRRAVPEPEEWQAARSEAAADVPGVSELFRGSVLRTTVLTVLVCAFSLSAHWAFMYWFTQHVRNLAEFAALTDADKTAYATKAFILVMVTSICGNFVAGGVARRIGYRWTIAVMCASYFLVMAGAYAVPRSYSSLLGFFALIGVCQGLFGLFTMYLPPLFPTLLRTTGAGFCYNIGRLAAAGATVFFGFFSTAGNHQNVLFYAAFLFLPAAAVAPWLQEPADEEPDLLRNNDRS